MNLAHLHLLLNHWPILGTIMGLGMCIASLVGRNDGLLRTSLTIFSLIALVAVPTYFSGNAAQSVIQQDAGVSEALIGAHEGAAILALVLVEITGLVAWLALWQFHRGPRPGKATISAVLIFSVLTAGVMAIAGNTGGQIRHPEMQSQTTWMVATMGIRLLELLKYAVAGSSRWVWPTLEALHFLGLALLLGAVGILNLRVLGFLKQLPLAAVYRFIPWGVAGLAVNTATGVLFFLGMPYFYVDNIDFQFKVIAIVLAGAILLLHSTGAFRDWEHLGPGEDAPPVAKFFAGSSIVLWFAVIALGRYIPYFE